MVLSKWGALHGPIIILSRNPQSTSDAFPYQITIHGEYFVIEGDSNPFSSANEIDGVSMEQTVPTKTRYTTKDFFDALKLFQNYARLDHFYFIKASGESVGILAEEN